MPESSCKFKASDWPYTFGMDRAVTHNQQQCPTCGLWTVYVNKKTGTSFSLCEGRESVLQYLRMESNHA